MDKPNRTVLCIAVAAAAAVLAIQSRAAQQPAGGDYDVRSSIELLRSDVQKQKRTILTDSMQLSEGDADKFWPIYREYEGELAKLADRRLELIKKYAENYDSMSDDQADELAKGVLRFEEDRNGLKKKYYERVKKALSARTAARFLQVESQLDKVIDLQIASLLPIVKSTAASQK